MGLGQSYGSIVGKPYLNPMRNGCPSLGKNHRNDRSSDASRRARQAFSSLVRSLEDTSGMANSQTKNQASPHNIDERYEREAGCK